MSKQLLQGLRFSKSKIHCHLKVNTMRTLALTNDHRGDRVGFGYVFKSCGHCQYCLSGNDNYCPDRQIYGFNNHDKGSMSDYAVWPAGFLFTIPDAMTSEDAAPMMCGGATVYNALSTYGVRPSDRVGVVGVGGLGHLAIQFAAKMGCEVVVFSTTEDKKAEAEKFGATEFYATKGKTELEGVEPVQHLIVTTAVQPDWTIFTSVLAPRATIFPLGASAADLKFPYLPFFFKGFTIQGSLVAPRHTHREMLEFAAVHGIRPVVQKFPMDVEGIEKAIETLKAGSMRYRGVLVAP